MIQHFAELDSTNAFALDWDDAPHGAVVWADSQTAGRGRLGRVWSSPRGKGLYFSLVWRKSVSHPALRAALGVCEAIESLFPLRASVKWPNDVLVGNRKIGGILCESKGEKLVVGVGLNLLHEKTDLPERTLFPASSLLLECGIHRSPADVLQPVVAHLNRALESDWNSLKNAYDARLFGANEVVRVGKIVGLLHGIGDDGALQIRTSDGLQNVVAGDVEWL